MMITTSRVALLSREGLPIRSCSECQELGESAHNTRPAQISIPSRKTPPQRGVPVRPSGTSGTARGENPNDLDVLDTRADTSAIVANRVSRS
jgi:hypothetical protein